MGARDRPRVITAAPTHVVPTANTGARLVDHVREHLAVLAAREIGPLIASGAVRIDGRVGRIAETIASGDRVTVDPAALDDLRGRGRVTEPEDRRLVPVLEDDDLLVVDKPHGIHVHPMGPHRSGTLLGALLWYAGARPDDPWAGWRPYPAHRLDRVTGGLMAVAKRRDVQDAFRRLLDDRRVERTYRAVVVGEVGGDQGSIDQPLARDPDLDYRRAVVPVAGGGQEAVTRWRVVDRLEGRTCLEVTLDTGRTHQIRAHLAWLGHPILGDELYTTGTRPVGNDRPRIELTAVHLAFPHPRTGEPMAVRRVSMDADGLPQDDGERAGEGDDEPGAAER